MGQSMNKAHSYTNIYTYYMYYISIDVYICINDNFSVMLIFSLILTFAHAFADRNIETFSFSLFIRYICLKPNNTWNRAVRLIYKYIHINKCMRNVGKNEKSINSLHILESSLSAASTANILVASIVRIPLAISIPKHGNVKSENDYYRWIPCFKCIYGYCYIYCECDTCAVVSMV